MQLSDPEECLIDYVSTNELIQALNTLEQIKEDEIKDYELSFSQSNHSLFQNNPNTNEIDFDLYMALKQNINKPNTNKNTKNHTPKSSKTNTNSRLSYNSKTNITPNKLFKLPKNAHQDKRKTLTPNNKQPLTEVSTNIINSHIINSHSASKLSLNNSIDKSIRKKKLSEIKEYEEPKKSRSQSPWLTNRSNLIPKTNYSSSTSSQLVFNNAFKSKKNKENEPIPAQTNIENTTKGIKILENSKKIMLEKEKKGQTYIPIQNRTNLLIKEKQEKIAHIKKMNLTQKEIEERECTFKPQINNYKKIYKENIPKENKYKNNHTTIESFIEETNNSQINYSTDIDHNTKINNKNEKKFDHFEKKDKPKNSKFNILLDLIH